MLMKNKLWLIYCFRLNRKGNWLRKGAGQERGSRKRIEKKIMYRWPVLEEATLRIRKEKPPKNGGNEVEKSKKKIR